MEDAEGRRTPPPRQMRRAGPATPSSAARARAFREADRNTRRVRLLRKAVPLIALGGVVVMIGLAFFNPFRPKEVEVDIGALTVSGDQLTMEMPRLTGFNKRNEAYNVTAASASQKLTAPGEIDLKDLDAVITMADKQTATLKAASGQFNSSTEMLTLTEKVSVGSTRGYNATMQNATVDFKAGQVTSQGNVTLKLENGLIEAKNLKIIDGGDRILFEGGVSTRFETRAVANPPEGLPPPDATLPAQGDTP